MSPDASVISADEHVAKDEHVENEAHKQKKSVKAPAVLAERSSLGVPDASDMLIDKLDNTVPAKKAELVSEISPVEQINVAPAAATGKQFKTLD